LAKTTEFKGLLFYLDVITKEERRREESKGREIEGDLEGLLVNLEMSCLGSLGTKD
jgi:hypothetical protein